MHKQNTSKNGFTIVELLIVVVVIAILAAISIVAYTGIQNRARTASAHAAATNVAKAAEMHKADVGNYPLRFSELVNSTSSVYTLEGVSLGGTLTNSTPDNSVHYAPCGTGSPANLAAITTANISGAILYYRDYEESTNRRVNVGTTSTTTGVACFYAGS